MNIFYFRVGKKTTRQFILRTIKRRKHSLTRQRNSRLGNFWALLQNLIQPWTLTCLRISRDNSRTVSSSCFHWAATLYRHPVDILSSRSTDNNWGHHQLRYEGALGPPGRWGGSPGKHHSLASFSEGDTKCLSHQCWNQTSVARDGST